MKDLKEAYLLMQANCDIKAGDTVKVLRQPKSFENGWSKRVLKSDVTRSNVGRSFTVSSVTGDSIILDVDGTSWRYPFFVLEKTTNPHWRDTVSPENPVLCYVRFEDKMHEEVRLISKYKPESNIFFTADVKARVIKAKRVPVELIDKLQVGYFDTNEEE